MAAIGTALKKRSDKVAFYGITTGTSESATTTYHRMRGFTDLSHSKNPQEYERQYIDEEASQTDVTGYSPSYGFAFDSYAGNAVHTDIAGIFDNEKTGSDAVRSIIVVDMTADGTAEGSKKAIKRDYAVIPDAEGDGTDAYTYSGNLKSKGDKEMIEVTSSDGWMTVTVSVGA